MGQELLESAGLPFIGTSAAAARHAFDKVTFSFFMLQACHIVCDLLFGAKGRITSCILNPKPYHVAHIVGILLSVSCFCLYSIMQLWSWHHRVLSPSQVSLFRYLLSSLSIPPPEECYFVNFLHQ